MLLFQHYFGTKQLLVCRVEEGNSLGVIEFVSGLS
jgi:hypothetical protein